MGNCDFKKNEPENSTGFSKANFQMHYVVGKGGYGKVWKVRYKKEGKEYAMKEMSKALIIAKKSVTSINIEREILSRVNHPFLCNMCWAFQDSDYVYLVMELSSGGDLRYHIYKNKKFSEKQTKFIAACLILALEYLHSLAIIHRDIKPENILFDKNGYLKLGDFGIARIWSPNNSNDTSGTPGYMAPEVVCATQHGFAADYWALGVILYELMMGRRPYAGINRKEYKERLLSTLVQVNSNDKPSDWSEESRDIINSLLQRKENMRLGSKGSQSVKDHPWFKDIEWDKLLQQNLTPPFIPTSIDENFDEAYLESYEKNPRLKEEIEIQTKNLRNPNTQKFFKDYYFDKDKNRNPTRTTTTSGSRQ